MFLDKIIIFFHKLKENKIKNINPEAYTKVNKENLYYDDVWRALCQDDLKTAYLKYSAFVDDVNIDKEQFIDIYKQHSDTLNDKDIVKLYSITPYMCHLYISRIGAKDAKIIQKLIKDIQNNKISDFYDRNVVVGGTRDDSIAWFNYFQDSNAVHMYNFVNDIENGNYEKAKKFYPSIISYIKHNETEWINNGKYNSPYINLLKESINEILEKYPELRNMAVEEFEIPTDSILERAMDEIKDDIHVNPEKYLSKEQYLEQTKDIDDFILESLAPSNNVSDVATTVKEKKIKNQKQKKKSVTKKSKTATKKSTKK